jgi:hypothetical protein
MNEKLAALDPNTRLSSHMFEESTNQTRLKDLRKQYGENCSETVALLPELHKIE